MLWGCAPKREGWEVSVGAKICTNTFFFFLGGGGWVPYYTLV